MTYEEACKALGYKAAPDLGAESRKLLIATADRMSAGGTKTIDPGLAGSVRVQVEMFG